MDTETVAKPHSSWDQYRDEEAAAQAVLDKYLSEWNAMCAMPLGNPEREIERERLMELIQKGMPGGWVQGHFYRTRKLGCD